MKREFRLRHTKDIQRLRKNGQTQRHRTLILFYAPRPADLTEPCATARVGVITGRQLGKAVVRNKVRRRLKAVMQRVLKQLPQDHDFLLLARKESAKASYQELETAVNSLLRRAGFLDGRHVQP